MPLWQFWQVDGREMQLCVTETCASWDNLLAMAEDDHCWAKISRNSGVLAANPSNTLRTEGPHHSSCSWAPLAHKHLACVRFDSFYRMYLCHPLASNWLPLGRGAVSLQFSPPFSICYHLPLLGKKKRNKNSNGNTLCLFLCCLPCCHTLVRNECISVCPRVPTNTVAPMDCCCTWLCL